MNKERSLLLTNQTVSAIRNIGLMVGGLQVLMLLIGAILSGPETVLFRWGAPEWMGRFLLAAVTVHLTASLAISTGGSFPIIGEEMEQIRDQLLPAHLWLTALLFWTTFSTTLSGATEPDLHITLMWAMSLLIGCCLALMALLTTLAQLFGMMKDPEGPPASEEQPPG